MQRAQAEGWRSRAVLKLEEIDRREKLLEPGAICLDLGAAPRAGSQYTRRRVGKGREPLDRAPNLSGVDAIDHPRSMSLAELALDMADRVLKREATP